MKTFHLKNDFNVNKSLLLKNFCDNDRPAELEHVKGLIERRGQHYTVAELRDLFGFLHTAHDDCVDENPEDYNPLQVYAAREKIRRSCEANEALDDLVRFQVAFVRENGSWDVVESFDADDREAANAYAEKNYAGRQWYVLDNQDRNINA